MNANVELAFCGEIMWWLSLKFAPPSAIRRFTFVVFAFLFLCRICAPIYSEFMFTLGSFAFLMTIHIQVYKHSTDSAYVIFILRHWKLASKKCKSPGFSIGIQIATIKASVRHMTSFLSNWWIFLIFTIYRNRRNTTIQIRTKTQFAHSKSTVEL